MKYGEELASIGPPKGKRRAAAGNKAHLLSIDLCVAVTREWKGITSDGEPIECNDENKRALFENAAYVDAVELVLAEACGQQSDPDRKNGSGGGSDSVTLTPASTVAATSPVTSTAESSSVKPAMGATT